MAESRSTAEPPTAAGRQKIQHRHWVPVTALYLAAALGGIAAGMLLDGIARPFTDYWAWVLGGAALAPGLAFALTSRPDRWRGRIGVALSVAAWTVTLGSWLAAYQDLQRWV